VSTRKPSISRSTVEWPSQVARSPDSAGRVQSGVTDGSGAMGTRRAPPNRNSPTVDMAVPNDDAGLRVLGAALLDLAAVRRTSFDVYREAPNRMNVYAYSFWSWTELNYDVDRRRMTVEDSRFRWVLFLTGMHARGGFQQEGVLPTAWSLVVDLVALAILLWIASGLYMWWGVRGHRRWGWLAIAFGTASFLVFALRL